MSTTPNPTFTIGDRKLSLEEMQLGVGVLGGVASGRTTALVYPLIRQCFTNINQPDDNHKLAKCGGLFLDESGFFNEFITNELKTVGREDDIIRIDPSSNLVRYNPIDPEDSAEENADKLSKGLHLANGGGENRYWHDMTRHVIKLFLQLLEVHKPKHEIGLHDLMRFLNDNELTETLRNEVEKTIQEKRDKISEEAFEIYEEAVQNIKWDWLELAEEAKTYIQSRIQTGVGQVATAETLQNVFCHDTNFDFREVANKGKIILFENAGLNKTTGQFISVCLKRDFQKWQYRRLGSASQQYGLNTTRTTLFVCDEFQEFVTSGNYGDENFFGVSRAAHVINIVSCHCPTTLENAMGDPEQTKGLLSNLATLVFLRSPNRKSGEFGAAVTGFKSEEFENLQVVTPEKFPDGPWYSEAIICHRSPSGKSDTHKRQLRFIWDEKLDK
jgi:hypothetical protein